MNPMKTLADLEQAVLNLICKIYCKEYIGHIDVIETLTSENKHLGYMLKLGLNNKEKPFTISCEGNPEQFLNFVEKELRRSNFNGVDFFKGIKYERQSCDRLCR